MLTDEKILLTGPAGQIAFPLAEYLAKDNEVWGLARFSNPDDKAKVEGIGVKAVKGDMGDGDFAELPDDFTYVIHFAALMAPGWDFDAAFRANAEGTGLLLPHCRKAKAALVMSTHSVSKIAQEAVARTCARQFDLPVTIARMNASYGRNGGLPVMQMDTLLAGDAVTTRWDPCMYSPIHQDDINAQTEALLDAASVPATIVNWAGDEPVSVQEWCAYIGELGGFEAVVNAVEQPGTLRGSVTDNTKRLALAGPCTVTWRDGIKDAFESKQGR